MTFTFPSLYFQFFFMHMRQTWRRHRNLGIKNVSKFLTAVITCITLLAAFYTDSIDYNCQFMWSPQWTKARISSVCRFGCQCEWQRRHGNGREWESTYCSCTALACGMLGAPAWRRRSSLGADVCDGSFGGSGQVMKGRSPREGKCPTFNYTTLASTAAVICINLWTTLEKLESVHSSPHHDINWKYFKIKTNTSHLLRACRHSPTFWIGNLKRFTSDPPS